MLLSAKSVDFFLFLRALRAVAEFVLSMPGKHAASNDIQIKSVSPTGNAQMKNSQLHNAARSFHNDEAGLEALQVVMILAVAAVALIAVKTQWTTIKGWYDQVMGDATSGWDT